MKHLSHAVGVVVWALAGAAAFGGGQAPPPARPTTVIPREGCVTTECHPGVKAQRYTHAPLNADACDACHRLTDAAGHRFEAVHAPEEACSSCHVIDAPVGSTLHKPVADRACLACHDPHGSREKALLRGGSYAQSCMACHRDITGAHDRVHGPASAGACGACHEPHASARPKLLVAEGRGLCLRCHAATGLQIETKPVVHEPAKGDCLVCHDPHATDHPGMISRDPKALCTGCHQDIAVAINGATTQHAAVTTQRECLNCHTPHAGDRARLLRTDEQTLCFECHDKPVKTPDGSVLANMKDVIEKGKSLHGAISQRSCVVCHQIHGGGHRRLLRSEYPTDLYYPFSENAYALCFRCHDRQLVMLPTTDAVTGFRNGERNLHYVHVNRSDKGRSCRVCHDAHASSLERHIREEVPYGPAGWKLPIKYERLADGGRCGAGCHAAFEYNRVKPLTYPTQRDGAWKGVDLAPAPDTPPPARPPKGPP